MNNKLNEVTKKWMSLERKTLEQRKIAEEFYEQNLMELIVEDYIERNNDQVFEEVKYLVVSVGMSYEPIVLNIKLFNPKRILFLHTEKTEKTLDKIISFCSLQAVDYEKKLVSETDPLDIYKEIKNSYIKWNKPEKMYIDFTGGTKAMSAAAAMAGAMIDIQLVYVGTENYLSDFRKPNPGSEEIFYITNPLAVFGDLEIDKAFELFKVHNYSGAKERLEYLKESVPEPEIRQQLNFVYLLSKSYESWDSLDFISAYQNMKELNRQILRDKMHKNYLLMDYADRLKKQENILEKLNSIPDLLSQKKNFEILKDKELIVALMFTMYQNGRTRYTQDKYDMATLLYYRLLEMIEQRRLAKYNLYVSQMKYSETKIHPKRRADLAECEAQKIIDVIKQEVGEIRKKLFGKYNDYLPDQISLLEGFIVLYVMHDPIVFIEEDDIIMLKRIRAMVFLRNNSIFAHGLGPVKKEDFEKFRKFVE